MTDFTLTSPDGQEFDVSGPDQAQDAREAAAQRMVRSTVPGERKEGGIQRAAEFLTSGDYDPVHLPGTGPKSYLRELAQNPVILDKSVEQASNFNFGGMASRKGMAVAGRHVPLAGAEEAAAKDVYDSNLRGSLRDAAWGNKAAEAADRRTQDYFETQTKTPKGYHWENGRLTADTSVPAAPEARSWLTRTREAQKAAGPLKAGGPLAAPLNLYHGSPNQFPGLPRAGRSGFVWWSPNEEWAKNYGPNLSRAQANSPRLLNVKSESAVGVEKELREAGIDTKGLKEPFGGDEEWPAEEVHQYLANTPGLAERIKEAGFHGVRHPDIREGQGVGDAIALVHGAPMQLNADIAAAQAKNAPLTRDVLTRGRSSRPNETAPLPIGNETAILERGLATLPERKGAEGLSPEQIRKADAEWARGPEVAAIEAIQYDRMANNAILMGEEIPEGLKKKLGGAGLGDEARKIYDEMRRSRYWKAPPVRDPLKAGGPLAAEDDVLKK